MTSSGLSLRRGASADHGGRCRGPDRSWQARAGRPALAREVTALSGLSSSSTCRIAASLNRSLGPLCSIDFIPGFWTELPFRKLVSGRAALDIILTDQSFRRSHAGIPEHLAVLATHSGSWFRAGSRCAEVPGKPRRPCHQFRPQYVQRV